MYKERIKNIHDNNKQIQQSISGRRMDPHKLIENALVRSI